MRITEITKSYFVSNVGIYKIVNTINNKVYVGSSSNLYVRWARHKSLLHKGTHTNQHLQKSVDKYGIDAFEFNVVEYCELDLLIQQENHYLSLCKNTYNIRKVAESNYGLTLTDEHKAKISDKLKGKMPKNYEKNILGVRNRKVGMYRDGELIQVFDTCAKAAEYLEMKPNTFSQYVGKQRRSKYYPLNVKFDYLED